MTLSKLNTPQKLRLISQLGFFVGTLGLFVVSSSPMTVFHAVPMGCYYPNCFDGITPFNGQTTVALNAVIMVTGHHELGKDVPSLAEAVRIEALPNQDDESGTPLEFDIDFNVEENTITLTPSALLSPNSWYAVEGIDRSAIDDLHYQTTWGGSLNTTQRIQFYTGSAPQLLTATLILGSSDTGYAEDIVVLTYSEPMNPISVAENTVILNAEKQSIQPDDFIESWNNMDNLFAFVIDGATWVQINPQTQSATGATLTGKSALYPITQDPDGLNQWIGKSFCTD